MDNINELADDTRAVLEDARDDASIREQRLEQADNAIQRADQERKQDAVLALLEEKIEALQATRAGQNDARTELDRFKKNWFSARAELEVSERERARLLEELKQAKTETEAFREALEWYLKDAEASVECQVLQDVRQRPAFNVLSDLGKPSLPNEELKQSQTDQPEQGDDLTTVYMVGREAGKDMVKADLERVQVEVRRLREVERLAKEYRAKVLARREHRNVSRQNCADAAYEKVMDADGPFAWRAAGKASDRAGIEWAEIDKGLTKAKRAAGEALFAALGKEDDRG